MLGGKHPKTECHIAGDLDLHYHRRDTFLSHMSLPCYKDPHNMIGTFVV